MSSNPRYFRELDKDRATTTAFFVIRGGALIALALLVLIAPRTSFRFVIVVAAAVLLINGLSDAFLLFRGMVVPHLRPQVIGSAAGSIVAALALALFPVLALRLLILISAVLLIIRGLLAIISIGSGDDETPVSNRRWLVVTAIASFALALFVLARPFAETDTYVVFVAILLLFEGIDRIRNAWWLATANREAAASYAAMGAGTDSEWRETDIGGTSRKTTIADATAFKAQVGARQGRTFRSWLAIDTEKYQRPMIIAPHPDDLEGFAGGLVFRLKHPAVSVVVCGGNKGVWEDHFRQMPTDEYVEVRLDEAVEAGRLLGVKSILYMGYLDRELVCNDESIARIRHAVEAVQPDLLVSFEYHVALTPYAHADHIATGEIVKRVVAAYSLDHPVDFLLTSTFAPNRFIDISTARRIKLKALACHTTQRGLNGIIFPIFERLITRIWGVFTNVQYAEGYRRVDLNALRTKLADEGKSA